MKHIAPSPCLWVSPLILTPDLSTGLALAHGTSAGGAHAELDKGLCTDAPSLRTQP